MKAAALIALKGLPYAVNIIEGAPSNATQWNEGFEFTCGQSANISAEDREKYFVDMAELKRLVESVKLVELLGGIEPLKRKIEGKHIAYTHFNINQNGRWSFLDHYIDFIPDSAYHIGVVNKAIADHEAIELSRASNGTK